MTMEGKTLSRTSDAPTSGVNETAGPVGHQAEQEVEHPHSLPIPTLSPSPGKDITGVLATDSAGGGTKRRAQAMAALQRTVGNARIAELTGGGNSIAGKAALNEAGIAAVPGNVVMSRPDDASEREVAHELTHVAQQGVADRSEAPIQRQERTKSFTEEETGELTAGELSVLTGSEESGGERERLEEAPGTPEAAVAEGEDVGPLQELSRAQSPTAVHKGGRIARKQYLRRVPDPAKGTNVVSTLPFNTLIFVEQKGGAEGGWYRIVTAAGEQGWVPTAAAALDPPEPNAELYLVQPGDTAIDLAAAWYRPVGGFPRWWMPGSGDEADARFYVAALAYANKGRAGMPSPADLTERDAWKSVKVIAGLTIWKPSKDFLSTLRRRVSSGSITRELWEDVKRAAKATWEWVVLAAAFIAGLLYGAGESIIDFFVGFYDLGEMIWKAGKSIIAGTFIADAKKLWETIKTLDVSALAEDFKAKWNADDPWDQGFFRGRVIGYIVMEIVTFLIPGVNIVKLVSKFGKAAKLLATVPKLAAIARKISSGLKLPPKLVRKVQKYGKFASRIEKLVMTFRRGNKIRHLRPISLKQLKQILGRAGVSLKPYKLQKVTRAEAAAMEAAGVSLKDVFGWVSRDGTGKLIRDSRGRAMITFTEKGLSSLEEAVKTFGHEARHIKDFAAGILQSSEAIAELAGEKLWLVVSKTLKRK